MTENPKQLTIIGRVEEVFFADALDRPVPAKIDTGADLSSVWASDIREHSDGTLEFRLLGPTSPFYSGQKFTLPGKQFRRIRFANSFGTKEVRYVVKLPITIKGRKVLATFGLADRSSKIYPVLLGRRLLNGKFLVDVSQGTPLLSAEFRLRGKIYIEPTDHKG